jgi:circadian clock protein KaiC
LLTARLAGDLEPASQHRSLEYATDCLIQMDSRVLGQITTRRLRVIKYRGSGYGSNEYPCIIGPEGIFLMPISTMGLQHAGLGETITCGNPELDKALGGGYRKRSSVLISGSAGTGKTTLLSTFVVSACTLGQKVLFVNFEESIDAMSSGMLSVGIDLRPFLNNKTLKMITAMPESMGSEEHLYRLFTVMEDFSPDYVVVDAISATLRIGTPQAAFEYLMRLVSTCKDRGITTLLSNQVGSTLEIGDISGLGISSLVDALLLLRYADMGNEIKRVFLAIKSRGMPHSNKHFEFQITDHGIAGIAPYRFPAI